jgi:WD40 repeat protein
VTIGIKHFKVWSVEPKTMKGKVGQFGKNCNILTSIAIHENKVYTGASDGSLHIWAGNSITKSQKLHDKSLNTICIYKGVLLTGGSDANIGIFQLPTLKQIAKINCAPLFTDSVCKGI